jgi:predicted metal-dependent phosphoesterase TrpH
MIDLHMHSIFSDGSLTPEALAEQGRRLGLSAIALTDHDSTAGLDRFLKACEACGIRGIPGVEVSAEIRKGTMHILGYFLDVLDPSLQALLLEIREGRSLRNRSILEKLNQAGLTLTAEEVAAFAGSDTVGRPHFAQAMLARKYVKTWEEAFDLYLGKGKAAYVERLRLSPEDSVKVIRGAGGVAVLSHPFTLDLDADSLRACLVNLKAAGLGGVEVLYPEHTAEQERLYGSLASELGLVVTGGSDFHGAINPGVRMGTGYGSLRVPDSVVSELEQRKNQGRVA